MEHGAGEAGHTSESLQAHLLGTAQILSGWAARQAVVDGGLFHSMYGTSAYRNALIGEEQRDSVRALIGAEAEGLAWLFGSLDHNSLRQMQPGGPTVARAHADGSSVVLHEQQVRDLALISLANAIEQLPRIPEHRRGGAAKYRALAPWAPKAAIEALDALLPA
jgi:hypothetical protein